MNGVISCLTILSLICSNGCRPDSYENDPFRLLYHPASAKGIYQFSASKSDSPSLTLSAHLMPFSVLSRVLSDTYCIGVVFSDKLFHKTITAEFKNTELKDVLNVISRQLNTDVVQVGNTYFVGKLRPEDRGILVRKVIGYTNRELQESVKSTLSQYGKLAVIGSGIVTAVDQQSVLTRVIDLLDSLDRFDQPVWIIQLAFLIIQRDALVEAGAKIATSGTISYNVQDNQFQLKDLNIDGIVNTALASSFADVHSSPMLLCREGSKSVWKFGKRVPIPKKSTSSYGVVTVTGYDYIDVGFTVQAQVEPSKAGGLLSLEVNKSDIESYVDYAPLTSQNLYQFTVDMVPNRCYLLGELQLYKDLNTVTDILNFGRTSGKSVIQLWGQIYRILPGTLQKYPYKFKSKTK